MLNAIYEIIKNWPKNKRKIYPYPSRELYDKNYYLNNCSSYDLFNKSGGKKLDFVRQMTIKIANPLISMNALDVGCGRGELVYALAKKGLKVTGIDFSEPAIELSKKTCKHFMDNKQVIIKKMNANFLEFPDDFFDLIFAGDIVEHLSDADMKKFIKESYRVLKPSGRIIIHTLPTVNYKRIGQYLVKWYFKKQGIPWQTITSLDESKDGHINIQSQKTLFNYLAINFSKQKLKVFYAPSNNQGLLKKIVCFFGLWKILCPHLWAIAKK